MILAKSQGFSGILFLLMIFFPPQQENLRVTELLIVFLMRTHEKRYIVKNAIYLFGILVPSLIEKMSFFDRFVY